MAEEALLQKKVIEYIKKLELSGHPIDYERRQAGGLSYEEGRPDLYCVYNGIHIEIELKRVGGEARARQEAFERKCRKKELSISDQTLIKNLLIFLKNR